MITVNDVSLNFSGQTLFKHVDLKFTPGNCYGIIGANGAGKTTFLRILSGDLEPTTGEVVISKDQRMSVLKQDHFQYDQYTVLDTVIMGNQRLYDIMKEKDALYAKEDFTDADGVKASELEAEFADMDGWEAESDVSRLIQGLGLSEDILYSEMSTLTAKEKVKVLLAQALFGKPDIILLDEPTNHLDIHAVEWLEDFILEYESLIIVVSHDRHFLNTVCTNIVDVDYGGIKMYVGNYEFWYESSQMMQRLIRDQNKKKEEKIKELQEFVSRFSANKSKSKQATARRKLLDKLTVEEMPASSRRYPFVGFKMDREPGKEILAVEGLTKTVDGRKVLDNVSFRVNLLQRLRPESGGLAGPVHRRQRGGGHRVLQAVLSGADAVLRRRRVQARQGPLRRREGPVHVVPDDAVRFQCPGAGPAHQPPGPGVHHRRQQRPDRL